MEGRLLLKDCAVLCADGHIENSMAILVNGPTIARVTRSEEISPLPGDWLVKCQGRLVTPGWFDCHSHLVGSQLGAALVDSRASGENPGAKLARIEAELAVSEVEALSASAIARSLRAGVTTLIEHLRCPLHVGKALRAQGRVAEALGARLVLSHASGDSPGTPSAFQQLEENASFAQARKPGALVRADLGFFSPSQCEPKFLEHVARLSEELNLGIHYHLGEATERLGTWARRHWTVEELKGLGLLGSHAVVTVGPALGPPQLEALTETGATLVLKLAGPKEAASPVGGWLARMEGEPLIGLGSVDGFSWWEELSAARGWLQSVDRNGPLNGDKLLRQMAVSDPAALRSRYFGGEPSAIREGSVADLVVHDWVFPNPSGTAAGLFTQLARAPAAWTIVAGQVVVREGRLLACDYLELANDAAKALDSIWNRIQG